MSKRNKILSIILIIAVLIVASLFIKKHFFDEKEIEVAQTSSIITKVESSTITLENKKIFSIKKAKKKQEQYEKGDKVRIEYDKALENEKIIPALSISLVAPKKESIKEPEIDPDQDIHDIINNMSVEEKVAQMFMVRCPSYNPLGHLEQYQMGGYILFDANIYPYTEQQFLANNQAFQNTSSHGMLIGLDEEGGTVTRLSRYTNYRETPFPSPQTLFKDGGFEAIQQDTIEKSELLKQYGVNMNFAPVADVSTNVNDFINARSFGKDAKQTSEYVKRVVSTMKQQNMGSVLKHFPGYGDDTDTHTGSAYDERPYENFVQNDFVPFEEGIKAGANGVLVSHNIVESIDPNTPASLSQKIHQILREDLHFDGVIFTDDLIMHAITNSYGDAKSAVLAVQAGNDMLLSSDHVVQIPSVIQAVQNNEISEERINASVFRILKLKKQLNVLK